MLRRKLCEATINWKVTCEGPLLIADGRYSQEQVMEPYKNNDAEKKKRRGWYPDKFFINKINPKEMIEGVRDTGPKPPENDWKFYVPGTSIRGPVRAQAERTIRTLDDAEPLRLAACDPFARDAEQNCGKYLEDLPKEKSPYAEACLACKLFGCAGLASRISFPDADIQGLNGPYYSVYRDMIGIDRFTGGVYKGGEAGGGANMRFHVLENTCFETTIAITNFELWHLGLLAYVFRDFREGLVPIGFGKTKGFGQVKAELPDITLKYITNTPNGIDHLGTLTTDDERSCYQLHSYPVPDFALDPVPPPAGQWSLYNSFTVPDKDAFWAAAAGAFNAYVTCRRQEREAARRATP